MKKKTAILILLAFLVSMLAACGAKTDTTSPQTSGEVEDGTLRAAILYDMTTMDLAQTTDNYMVPINIYDRLFEIKVQPDGSTQVEGSLVTDYSVSPDGLVYDFTLREGVVFSNDNPLTASDVQYTFERLLTAGGVNDDIPLEVVGAEALQSGQADTLSGFTVKDDQHFSIALAAPNAGFIAELTAPAMSIMDQESVEAAKNFGIAVEDTIGSSAYKITEWVPNDHYTLEYNEKYWGAEPDVKKIIVSVIPEASTQNLMFQKGELDMIDLDNLDASIVASTYQKDYADQLVTGHRVGLTYMAMNENNEYLSDVTVRKAIQMAIDRDTILASVFNGQGVVENGIIPSGVWGHNDNLAKIAYDTEAAKALLENAGYQQGDISFELSMDSSSTSATQMVYQLIQQDLQKIGINAEIVTYDESAWLDLRKSGDMDSFVATWTMDYNDPANIMYTFFGGAEKTAIRSLNYYDLDTMDRVAAAPAIVEDAARMAEYQALEEKIVVQDAAWVPLYESTHLFAIGERVAEFIPHWAGFTDFYGIDVTLK